MKKRYKKILLKYLRDRLAKLLEQKVEGTCCNEACKWIKGINREDSYKYFSYFGGKKCEKIFIDKGLGKITNSILLLINKKEIKTIIYEIFKTFRGSLKDTLELIITDKGTSVNIFKLENNKIIIIYNK